MRIVRSAPRGGHAIAATAGDRATSLPAPILANNDHQRRRSGHGF